MPMRKILPRPIIAVDMERTHGTEGEPCVGGDQLKENSPIRESTATEGDANFDVEPDAGGDQVKEKSPIRESIANEGDADLEPFVGMKFESEAAAYLFYNEYARRLGFGISKKSTRRSRTDRALIAGEYACTRHGFKKSAETSKPRPATRIGCKAIMKVKRMAFGKWVIVDLIKEHNHELDPKRAFRSHSWRTSRYQQSKICSILGKQPDGSRNTKLTEKDTGNNSDEEQGKLLAAGDVEAIHEHFMDMQLLNPTFFYALELDEEQHLRNVFWADSKSRMAYTYFGDVVTIDTSYLAKKYRIPLATFMGVNHHGQPLLLGCALITDQTTSSFIWVFKTWLRAMSGRAPLAIITDQDKAIKEAILEVFPNVRHRFCLWHIQKKIHEKLGHLCKPDEKFLKKFNKCIYDSTTVDEFEKRWRKLIENFDLTRDEWLQTLYEDRQQWVLAYLKDAFFAGMSISQRNESIDSFFDAYVSSNTTLKEFLEQYETALQNLSEKEAQADFNMLQLRPSMKTPSPFEAQMASIYTRNIFMKFQVEASGITACHTINIQEEGATRTYTVRDLEEKKDYIVVWNGFETKASCSCHLFECRGFLCRHAMVVLVASGLYEIPSHYILKRWTKDAKNRRVLDQGSSEIQGDCRESMIQRFNDLCQRAVKFVEEGSLSDENYSVALHALKEALEKVVIENNSVKRLLQHRMLASNKTSEGSQADSMADISVVLDARPVRTKGHDKGMKSGFEKSATKTKKYTCSHCKKTGHNVSTCKAQLDSGVASIANQYGTQGSLQQMGQLDMGVMDPDYSMWHAREPYQ
ncbi:protein FAR-RED IMPAIRED RESPONSE 1-like isoform X2 [Tasmannia lanceolata]|uniref:protein FAR-RED IMPAIRED RESPONSE 1-like isoform X2 n=1 Tax=Tasmannia lanceolata TaxID=3420 RepID=UPI00406316F2